MVEIRQVGTIDPYIAAALAPDGSTLYVNHDGSEVIAYSYPDLVAGSTVITPGTIGGDIGSIACDAAEVLYWWDHTPGGGIALYKSTDPVSFFSTVEEPFAIGLCWSPYDGLLYGFGMVDVVEGEVLSSYDPSIPGGDRQVVDTPVGSTSGFDWYYGTVPTPNGSIWYVRPQTAAAFRVYLYDPTAVNTGSRVAVVESTVVPWNDNNVYWYGDPSGAAPAAGYFYDFEQSRDVESQFDQISPGQRAAAYNPSFTHVCFERGATGEVWEFVGRKWWVGSAGWA